MFSEFALKALTYGVVGLCAVMLVVAGQVLVQEQRRQGQPRRGIIRFTLAFMIFCVILASLTGERDRQPKGNTQRTLRQSIS